MNNKTNIEEDIKILEDNYQMLSESVSNIAKELDLQEDATIDEIYTAIRILKSKRINMFEQLECIAKANKYDSLVEKLENEIEIYKRLEFECFNKDSVQADEYRVIIKVLQKLLEEENKHAESI